MAQGNSKGIPLGAAKAIRGVNMEMTRHGLVLGPTIAMSVIEGADQEELEHVLTAREDEELRSEFIQFLNTLVWSQTTQFLSKEQQGLHLHLLCVASDGLLRGKGPIARLALEKLRRHDRGNHLDGTPALDFVLSHLRGEALHNLMPNNRILTGIVIGGAVGRAMDPESLGTLRAWFVGLSAREQGVVLGAAMEEAMRIQAFLGASTGSTAPHEGDFGDPQDESMDEDDMALWNYDEDDLVPFEFTLHGRELAYLAGGDVSSWDDGAARDRIYTRSGAGQLGIAL